MEALHRPDRVTANPCDLPQGTIIGAYHILEKVGEGGFGVVYRAEQHSPVRRQVALKLIKPGMDSKAVLARFDAERQALALMEHVHIARILDGGMTPDGRPFFVMDFIKGLPITDYCDQQRLGTSERLKLIQQTCRGVQHAHQKGVIHRDLKPANILVELQDGKPMVKIIDFGVAKAVGQQLTEKTLFTALGQLVGTLDYMAPEQVTGSGLDIDTRADVYSLGSVLYEILTGVRPLDFGTRSFDQIVRTICENPPSKPSTRVSTHGGQPTKSSSRLGTDQRSLSRQLRADLDWITLKALEKDRNRRYASASDLADDIERHLAHQPVLASPPSVSYRVRKFVGRNRVLVFSIVLIAVTLIVSSIVSVQFAREALAAADAARHERNTVLRLSAAQELADLRREVDTLWPLVPRMKDSFRDWLVRAQALLAGLEPDDAQDDPGHYAQLAALRARALPLSARQREEDRRSHPRFAELASLEASLAALRRTQSVREGRAGLPLFDLDTPELTITSFALCSWATQLAGPGRAVFGREAEGIALAHAAVDCAQETTLAMSYDTLAWCLFSNGLDDEALSAGRTAIEHAGPDQQAHYEGRFARLSASVDNARAGVLSDIAETEAQLALLKEQLSTRRTYTFASAEDGRWHTLLEKLVREIEVFSDRETGFISGASPRFGWGVERRLATTKDVEERTLSGTQAKERWVAAIAAIGDPETCPQYAGLPLVAQVGLLPIGPDPDTGLWEFAHVVSGAVPERDAQGLLKHTADTGLVLVLIPGGPLKRKRAVAVSPFFLSKYEMTQAQWLRFTAENPSLYHPMSTLGIEQDIDLRHPVEMVSWTACETVLGRLGLTLPSDAQWSYAARAGTRTTWWTGDDKQALVDAANLMDRSCRLIGSQSWDYEEWDDGYGTHSPVGVFRANPFGLHDVYGNVWEWCWDGYEQGFVSRSAVDPARNPAGMSTRIFHGGSYFSRALQADSRYRRKESPDYVDASLGVRPARVVEP